MGFYFGIQASISMNYLPIFTWIHYLDFCCFVTRECESSKSVLFFRTVLTIQGPLPFHANFRISLFIFVKRLAGILIGINNAWNPYINGERADIFLLNI